MIPNKQDPKKVEHKPHMINHTRYTNFLPDIPMDLKFLKVPMEPNRFTEYRPTSLERAYKYDVLTHFNLGVIVDLVQPEIYEGNSNAPLHPDDEKLLEDDDVPVQRDTQRVLQHTRSVSWLRKSEYISTEQTRFQPTNPENIEAKVGFNINKALREETLYLDRSAQIKAIEKTFNDTKMDIIKHHKNPDLKPIDIAPLFPDWKNWKYACAQIIFDSNPIEDVNGVPANEEGAQQAIMPCFKENTGENYAGYFLPTKATLKKRRRDLANNILFKNKEKYEFKLAREYNWTLKKQLLQEFYFFVIRPGEGVYFNKLEHRLQMNKRHITESHKPNYRKIMLEYHNFTADEKRVHREREEKLKPIEKDEEDMATNTENETAETKITDMTETEEENSS